MGVRSDRRAYRENRRRVFSILQRDEVTARGDAEQRGEGRCELQYMTSIQ